MPSSEQVEKQITALKYARQRAKNVFAIDNKIKQLEKRLKDLRWHEYLAK